MPTVTAPDLRSKRICTADPFATDATFAEGYREWLADMARRHREADEADAWFAAHESRPHTTTRGVIR